ncbi:kinase [Steroidobacter flavus]|uniref:Kinase n=1 Tax=Steroidobacter flavus TaxID=1842136 RepID=A0ABV8T249_9GAMM
MSSFSASCHASFGELLQGMLPDGSHFLVTLPIDLHSHASFTVSSGIAGLSVWPESSWKVLSGVTALLRRYGLPVQGQLRLQSDIPRGKGLASSTADLVASCRAVARHYDLSLDLEVLEATLRDIEPSDGVMYEGVVAYRHRQGRLLEELGPVPALTLVAVDEGGEIETLAHNARSLDYSESERDEYVELLAQVRHALQGGDVAGLGAVATRSALLNQRLLPKRWFDAMRSIAREIGAAGVVAAHSGTFLGIMIDAAGARHESQVQRAIALLEEMNLTPMVFRSLSRP